MTMTTNGRAERKSLAAQLDRLDLILDGLADGLNEAVAAAVKVAVTAAVEAALVEVLTSAELQAHCALRRPTSRGGSAELPRCCGGAWSALRRAAGPGALR
jgi:hypothetical protein